MKKKRAFSLTELLVVIAIIAVMLAILIPSLSKARLQAKVLIVNAELADIGLALEAYATDNHNNFPPTRIDCNPEARKHAWALPQELVKNGYMPGAKAGSITYSKMEDKFNSGLAYKYMAVGKRYDYSGTPMSSLSLKIPDGFPDIEGQKYTSYKDPKISPVTWIVFSVGPKYDEQNEIKSGFPVDKKFWYSPKTHKGIITRVRLLKQMDHIGTFQKSK
ncbi:MAG: hypothetical protein A2Y10_14950 [Planctomycetes bacterium GWF2_41_51]|nr:MAG: hypothetical protein A2Y10_14950 [Planctomycetes bacterium GWF2_41_51]HBG28499.1 hypothetical protein [Phycisphaerales bacterium]